MSLTASGLSVQTQSLLSILVGGIAFETPRPARVLPPAEAEHASSPLFGDRASAFKLSARNPQTYVLIFKDSVRGLAPGAPVEFRGIPIGEVVDIQAQIDAETFEFSSPVTIRVDAARLGVQIVDLPPGTDFDDRAAEADRHPGRARRARPAAQRQPADRRAVRLLRFLP